MKILTLILFILTLTITGFSQGTPNKVEVKYDKFKDVTDVNLALQMSGEAIPMEGMTLIFASRFDGIKPTSTTTTIITFFSINKRPLYKILHSLIVLADGERMRFGEGTYADKSTETKSIEVGFYSMSQENLKRIASAKKVEMQLGSEEFTLTESQLKAVREFYSRLVP